MIDYCSIADVRGRASGLASEDNILSTDVTTQITRARMDVVRILGDITVPATYQGVVGAAQADLAASYCIRFTGAAEGVSNVEADRLRSYGLKALEELLGDPSFREQAMGMSGIGLTTTPHDDPTIVSPFSRDPSLNTPLNNMLDPNP